MVGVHRQQLHMLWVVLLGVVFHLAHAQISLFVPSSITEKEERPVGYEITTVSALVGFNTMTSGNFGLEPNQDSHFFSISTSGAITFAEQIDTDVPDPQTLYNIVVTFTYGGITGKSENIPVTLEDINDNTPSFNQTQYEVTLPEASPEGYEVFKAFASDLDDVESQQIVEDDIVVGYEYTITNGLVTYSILEGNEENMFMIDQTTGAITVATGSSIDVDTVDFYNLTLQAKDGGNLASTSQLLITILDSNDNAPIILYPDNFTVNISEDVIPSNNVIIDYINATDDDHGVNSELYFAIIDGDVTNSFEINSQTGLVTLVGELDREVQNPLQLIIAAIDKGNPPLQDTLIVTVYILDVNDQPPTFTSPQYNFSIFEGSNINIQVGTVTAVDHDEGGGGIVSYYFKEPLNDFRINNDTGVITTASFDLDREIIPLYSLTVIAVDNPDNNSMVLNSSVTVNIEILDINDNSPEWSQSEYSVGILDTEMVGYQLINLTATDADIGANGQVQYTFTGTHDSAFSIDSVTGIVTLAENIDFNTKQKYSYNVRAKDGGTQPKSQSVSLTIYVHTPNKNPPFFLVKDQNFTLSENTSVGTVIVNVTAFDKDIGLIGEVRYHIVDGTEFDGSGSFDVDMHTGAVFINESLDYDYKSAKYIFFQVEAYDGGFPDPFTDLTNITVYLTNVNDEVAKIIIPVQDTPTIPENLPPYVEFANLSSFTIDEDPGDGGLFEFELLQIYGDNDYGDDSFNLTDDGILAGLRTFDREENPEGFILSIKTTDFGQPSLTLINNVTVLIGDENDEEPFFEPNTTSVQVYELRFPGMTVLGNFTANDYDIGINAELDYVIADGDTTDSFTVDSTGTIYTTKPLNKTEERYYTLTIQVVDKGSPPLYGYGEVFVEVLDINDNSPVFNEPLIASFNENDQPGTVFYQLNATDADEDVNSQIVYYLSDNTVSNFTRLNNETNSTFVRFIVNETTGEVAINDMFDRETESEFQLVVVAVDMGVVPGTLNTSVTLTVLLEDYNDHTPEFLNDSYIFSVTENESPTTPIGQIHAKDNDASVPNNDFSFRLDSILWGNDNISINSTTGVLYVNGVLDWETSDSINVTVYAEDHGTPSRMGTVGVTILIEDVNDRAPEWIESSLSLEIQENLPEGSSAGFIQAIDPDSFGNNSLVYYTIVKDDMLAIDYFEVNRTTGEVSSLVIFNRETVDMYNVTVVAYDSGSPQQSSVATLMIDILDYNDYKPYFSKSSYNATVSENIPVGTTILELKASDNDVGKNAELTFSIPSPYYSSFFSVNEESGELESSAVLDFEGIRYFEFQVLVTDNGVPQRNDTAIVKITLTNFNDEMPVFEQSIYSISFVENIPVGSNLLRVQANDVDSEVITYSLQPTNGSAYFEIDPMIGMLYTVDFINREVLGSNVELIVIANNSADLINPLSSSVSVNIEILDLNDQPPWLDYVTPVLISEDTSPGTVVYTLVAEDGDEGSNGTIIYDNVITNDDGLFTINVTSGQIILKEILDYETQVYHYVGVTATDMGLEPLTGHTTVIFQVTDSNDNAPTFVTSMYRVSIQSTVGVEGDEVLQLYAFDKDSEDTIQYSIISGNEGNLFSISKTTGRITVSTTSLESYPDHMVNLTVQASDGLNNDTAVVLVHIVDGDDPPLLFDSLSYSTSVTEGVSSSSVYDFYSEVTSPSSSNVFTIVEGNINDTFELALNGMLSVDGSKLDYETQSVYQLSIFVNSDSYSILKISVEDANEFTPVFSSATFHAQVYETIEAKQPFYTVHAEDGDGSSPNNKVTYTIISGNADGIFAMNANSGELSLNQRLDYDVDQHNYTLTVSAQNQASTPTLNEESIVTVELLNGNRHAPSLIQIPTIPPYLENTLVGTELGTVQAIDKDNHQQSNVTYTLLGDHRHYDIDINGTTGVISVGAGGFDYERQTEYSIIIVVSDDEVPTLTSTAVITFPIIDENDNSPEWTEEEYSANILESTSVGTNIVTLLATDADHIAYNSITDELEIDNGHVRYSITAGDPKNQFSIIEDTFVVNSEDIPTVISVASALDREDISGYNLTVTATDGGGRSTDTYVRITLIDVNDVVPSFNDTAIYISVSEHTYIGDLITTVPAIDTDLLANSLLVYSISSGNVNDMFSINNATAEVYLEKELDREVIDSYAVGIEAVDSGVIQLTGSTVLYVTVIDENEFPPVFIKPLYSSSVNEDIGYNEVIVQVVATDQDTGINSDIVYSIANSTVENQFSINSTSGEITINMELDYEAAGYHELVVVAEDSAHLSQRLSSSVIVEISVLDVNDNVPIFDHDPYSASIYEGEEPFTDILQVIADDVDSGLNSEIRYSLAFLINDTNAEISFEIDELEGNVTLSMAPALDYEVRQSYHFYAVASDMGTPALSSTVSVLIDVLDVNDNRPIFMKDLYTGSVMENLSPGQELLTVAATDGDSNENAEIVYSLREVVVNSTSCISLCPDAAHECTALNGLNTSALSLDDLFAIDPVNGLLTTNSSFDRELVSNYAVVIVATDSSVYDERLSSESCAFVTILDDNDQVPLFLNLPNNVSVAEEQSAGVSVFNVSATDLDIDNNSLIMYESADNSGHFTINPVTGEVYTIASLDRENVSEYDITITAKDNNGGVNANTATSQLVVTVLDINDSPPVFEEPFYTFSISEDSPQDTLAFSVSASDSDISLNGVVQYQIVSTEPQADFYINSTTGDIRVLNELDRELYAEYSVSVLATDSGIPPLSSTTTVNITITDVNDNPPRLSQSLYTVDVDEELEPQDPILSLLTVNDEDLGVNRDVQFSLIGHEDLFEINATSGDVYMTQSIDYESVQRLNVTILVDNAYSIPSLSSSAILIVNVNDLNDNPPVFSSSLYHAAVQESRPPGYRVLSITATDADGTFKNRNLTYSIINSTDLFKIDPHTGEIFVNKPLDSDSSPTEYSVIVYCEDNGGLSDTTIVTITLTNVNDNPPIFVEDGYSFDFPENEPTGVRIGSVLAMDADNDSLIYYISEDEMYSDKFTVNAQTGEIFSNFSFDRESQDQYMLTVTVVDNPIDGFHVNVTVFINITDLNDNFPVFPQNSYTIFFKESTDLDTLLLAITADDSDLDLNAVPVYSIESSDLSSYFYVNESTGDLYLNKTLDREDIPMISITLAASDKLDDSLFSTATLTLHIIDVNDNPPIFTQDLYNSTLSEAAANGSIVTTDISATDADIGENSRISYNLADEFQHLFFINDSTGVVSLISSLNYELAHNYSVTLYAKDHGIPQLETTSELFITLVDVNDNSPYFEESSYTISVLENSVLGTLVFTVPAIDIDDGLNGKLQYTILSGNVGFNFELDQETGLMSLADSIDYETEKSFALEIQVVDMGIPQYTALTTVNILIEDVNDNSPEFTQNVYHASVPEDKTSGFIVSTEILATDADSGPNGLISYYIVSGNGNNTFSISEENGHVSVNGELDYNTKSSYSLMIMASDGGSPPLSSVCQLVVTITDVNEYAPVIYSHNYYLNVSQFTAIGTTLAHLFAYDPDTDLASPSYTFTSDSHSFGITPAGELYVNSTLVSGQYTVTVTISDGHYNTTVTLGITVYDLLYTGSTFDLPTYLFTVPEDIPVTGSVGIVSVNGEFDSIDFISPEGDLVQTTDEFSISQSSGSVTTAITLDYETTPYHIINVRLVKGDSQLYTIMTVRVIDVNDNPPLFDNDQYLITLSEWTQPGTRVIALTTTDADSAGTNSDTTLSVTQGGEYFEIDTVTGALVLMHVIDRESTDEVTVVVLANNTNTDVIQYSTTQVLITVGDENDNNPEFDQTNYYVNVFDTTPIGHSLLTLSATDQDEGLNSQLVFSISHQSSPGSVIINQTTGVIRTSKVFTDLIGSNIEISVLVSDKGVPTPRTSSAVVAISVLNTNLHSPVFTQPGGYEVAVDETVSIGALVTEVSATDADNDTVSYSMLTDSVMPPFVIAPMSGVITISGELDYLTQNYYSIIVAATDDGVPVKTSLTLVNVSVIDINTHSPVFTQDEYETEIIENITVGSFVIQVNAIDLDAASIRYAITLNYPEGGTKWFRINETTGKIYIDSPVDRELNEQVALLVSAIDTGYSIQRSTSINVIVSINDVNDEYPVFTVSPYDVDVIRLTPPNYPILQVVANDSDISSSFISYNIEYQTFEGLFTIGHDNGWISTTSVVPENITNNTVIVVSAFDGDQKSNVTVRVRAVTEGTFCVDGFCTKVEERHVTCFLFGGVCNPECLDDNYALSPLDWLCVNHYCENNSLVTCVEEEKCVLPNQICNGNCPDPETQSKCQTTDLCYDTSRTDPCDDDTCLTQQTLVQSANGIRTCNTSSTLPPVGQDCVELGYVYCTRTDNCSSLTSSQLCSYCPEGLIPCPDTKACVNDTKYCCGANGYYCEVLDGCLINGQLCKLPNIAPKVTNDLVYHSSVTDVGEGVAKMVGVLLGNSSTTLGTDSQSEEVGVAIVEVAGSNLTLGVWQYAECQSSDPNMCKKCDNVSSWTTITDGLSDSHSLFLPNTACLRYTRNSLHIVGASWLRVKLWDGNTDGYISPEKTLVRDQQPFYNTTLPYTVTGSTSEASTLLTVLITALNSQPVFGVSDPSLTEIPENVKLQDNIGDSVTDTVGTVSFEHLPVIDSKTIKGLPELDGLGNTVQYTNLLPADALGAFYSAIDKVNPTRVERQSPGIKPSIAIQMLPSDLVNGDWQVTMNGDPQLFTNLANIADDLILLDTTSRIRFVPKPYFNGVAMVAVYAWDGVLPQPVQERTLNGILVRTAARSHFLPQTLNSVYYLKVHVTQVEQQPVIISPTVSLSAIPYSIRFTYSSLFTITIAESFDDLEASVVEAALKLTDLGNSFTIHNMLPAANDRSYVTFSIQNNALNKSEIQSAFDAEENLNNVLPIEELNQYASYGGNIACDDSVTKGEINGDLVNSLISDAAVDNDGDYLGMAVIGISGLEQGVWQYSRGDGTLSGVWFSFPSKLTQHSALLLHGNDSIRYIPKASYYWTTASAPSLTVKAWDNSQGTITEYSEQEMRKINTDPYTDTLQSIHKPRGQFSIDTAIIRASRFGCDKVADSGKRYDACCNCGGSGSGCDGCDGVASSNKQLDSCGQCDGGDGSCTGCDGVPYSFVTPGPCSECVVSSDNHEWSLFNETFRDCDGLCHGQAMVDDCGVCSGELNGHEYNSNIDCHGVCFGKNALDDCQYCTGPDTGLSFNQHLDCTGVCDGPFRADSCNVCQLPNEHGDVMEHRDCNGVCHGTAQLDTCGTCYGGNTGVIKDSQLDLCGVCSGNSSTCDGCDNVRNSGLTIDNCGVCGGNNCGCEILTSTSPDKGSANGGTEIVITGAGFFLNTSSYNPNLINCNVPKTKIGGHSVLATCQFLYEDELKYGTAHIVDQDTIICDSPSVNNKNQLYDLKVRIEDQSFIQPSLSFRFQSYNDINIISSTPSMALINDDNITVTFTGDNFIDNKDQMKCLMKDDSSGCLSHLPVDSNGYHSVEAEFKSSTSVTCLMPVSTTPCEVSLYLSFDGQQSGIVPYQASNAEKFVYAFSPPIVTTVHFTDNLDTLVIQFDRSVNVNDQSQLTCAALFDNEMLKLIGEASYCTWGNSQRTSIYVQLTIDSNIAAGTLIQFKEDTILTAEKDFSFGVSETLLVQSTTHPTVILEGPSSIPSCGTARFTAVNSYHEGYSSFEYQWSVYTLDAVVSGVKDLAEYTNGLSSSQSSIELPSNLFQLNTEYVVQVVVTNAVGMSSRRSKELTKESTPSLKVSVSSPEYLTIGADQEVLLQANIVNSDCEDIDGYEFDWTVSRLTNERRSTYEVQSLPGVVVDNSLLYIPGGSLLPANKYKLSVTVTSSLLTNTQTIHVTVNDVECRAIVSGGNRTIPVGQQLVLDASTSVETTSATTVSYIWQCSLYNGGLPCYDASVKNSMEVISLPFQKQISLSTSKLNPGVDYLFTLTLSQGNCESQFDTVISIVSPTNSPPAVVEILTLPLTQLSPSQMIAIEGLVHPSEPVDIVWDCLQLPDHSHIDLDTDVLLSPSQYSSILESETSSHNDHVIQDRANTVNLVLRPGVLNDTLPYLFQLTAYSRTDTSRNASAFVTIIPRVLPRIHSFIISPTTGTEASTIFELRVERVTANVDHYPLLYQYGVVTGHGVQWLSGVVSERVFNTLLPAGSPMTVIVRVYNNIGGWSESSLDVQVGSSSSVSLSLESVRNSLSASSDWVTAVSSFQTMLISMENIPSGEQSDVISLYYTLFNQYIPKTKANAMTVLSLADSISTKSANMDHDNRMVLLDTVIKTMVTLQGLAEVNFNDIHSSSTPTPQGLSNNRYGNNHFVEVINISYVETVFEIVSTLTNSGDLKELQVREALHHLLCLQTVMGEYPITLMSDESKIVFMKGVPVGSISVGTDTGFDYVELDQHSFIELYNKLACPESAEIACSETCIQLALLKNNFGNDYVDISATSEEAIYKNHPFTDPEQITIISGIVSFDISLPTDSDDDDEVYTRVDDNVLITVHFHVPAASSIANGSTLLCMYSGSSVSTYTGEWHIESAVDLPTLVSNGTIPEYSCTYTHLSQFAIGLLPPPVPVVPSSSVYVSPSPSLVRTTTSSEQISLSRSPVIVDVSKPFPVAGTVSGVIVALIVAAAVIIIVIVIGTIFIKKKSKVHPKDSESRVEQTPLTHRSESSTLSEQAAIEVPSIHLGVIQLPVDPEGERLAIGNLDVPQPSRLRELRNLLCESFPQLQNVAFYLCTSELNDIAPDTEQQQFVRLVYSNIVYVRQAQMNHVRTRKEFCVCGKVAEMQCSRCNLQGYCSQDCQTNDWENRHRIHCNIEAERAKRSDVLKSFASRSSVGSDTRKPSTHLPPVVNPSHQSVVSVELQAQDRSIRESLDTTPQTLLPSSTTQSHPPAKTFRRPLRPSIPLRPSQLPSIPQSPLPQQQEIESPTSPLSGRPSVPISPRSQFPTLPRRQQSQVLQQQEQQIFSPVEQRLVTNTPQVPMFMRPSQVVSPSLSRPMLVPPVRPQPQRGITVHSVQSHDLQTSPRSDPTLNEENSSSSISVSDAEEENGDSSQATSRPPSLSVRKRSSSQLNSSANQDSQASSGSSSSDESSSDENTD